MHYPIFGGVFHDVSIPVVVLVVRHLHSFLIWLLLDFISLKRGKIPIG